MMSDIVFLVLGICSLLLSLVLMVFPVIPAAIASYGALCLLHWSEYITVAESTFIFWGIATLLLMTIARMSPRAEWKVVRQENVYIAIGALAGMLLGMTLSASVVVLGVAIGGILGLLAFVNTPKGKLSGFSLSTFIHYFCTKGLPVIIAMAMIGIAIEGFLLN